MRLGVAAAVLTLLLALPVVARERAPNPFCDVLVRPEILAEHTGQVWLPGPGIKLRGDTLACNYYQRQPPAGLSLSVRLDQRGYDYLSAKNSHPSGQEAVSGLGDQAFYFRVETSAPFQPSWGLVVYSNQKTYRLEGVLEMDKAGAARALAREIIERTMKQF